MIEKIEGHIENSTDEAEWEEMLLKGESICYYGLKIQDQIL